VLTPLSQIRSYSSPSSRLLSQPTRLRNSRIPATLITFGFKACSEPAAFADLPTLDYTVADIGDCALIGTGVNQYSSQLAPPQPTSRSSLAAITATLSGSISHWRYVLGFPCCWYNAPAERFNAGSEVDRALTCLPGVWEGSYMVSSVI